MHIFVSVCYFVTNSASNRKKFARYAQQLPALCVLDHIGREQIVYNTPVDCFYFDVTRLLAGNDTAPISHNASAQGH